MATITSKLAITCGDPAGLGPEIIARWVGENPGQAADLCLIGPLKWLEGIARDKDLITTLPVGPADFEAVSGKPTETGARVALEALEEAAAGCREGRFRAVVTAPVSKAWMQRIGFIFPGQTEFFAERWGGAPTMAFVGDKIRVVLVTWHVPLMTVKEYLEWESLERAVRHAYGLAQRLEVMQPRIGVCGLNPHAGEGGLLGVEEEERLNPMLHRLRADYPGLSSCLPADTLFWRHLQGEFDVVLALYHDQGLAPLKTVDFESAAQITLGLPWVRTSPDHGTGFAVAGKEIAQHTSLANAVALARRFSCC